LLVIAAGAGGLVGTALGARLPSRSPQSILVVTLVVTTAVCVVTAVLFGVWTALLMAFVGNFAQTIGKLALDSIVQRDVEEAVRTSTFARSETVNQLTWVVGGGIGIALPFGGTWGFAIAAIWLVAALVVTVRAPQPSRPAPGPARARGAAQQVVPDSGRVA
jgi:predicted MFS family arabinose efflux permease